MSFDDNAVWNSALLSPEPNYPGAQPGLLYELFHENSKTSRYEAMPTEEEVVARMQAMWQSLPYDMYPAVDLPADRAPLLLSLSEAILSRTTARGMRPRHVALAQVSTLLHYAYGITRDNADTIWPRPFRTVPSGGALYPLEIYFHSAWVPELQPGVYHFNPTANKLRMLIHGDQTAQLASAFVQSELAPATSILFFITAAFERSTFKYGDRGYRFALLEAGHVAQNLNLVATALGLGCVNIGGFFDREIDDLLALDGVTHSTLYLVGVGRADADATEAPPVSASAH